MGSTEEEREGAEQSDGAGAESQLDEAQADALGRARAAVEQERRERAAEALT